MLSISPDSYIRLTFDQLQAIPLEHLISDLDDPGVPLWDGAADGAAVTGYTEWTSAAAPRITLGWDWELVANGGAMPLCRLGLPRSNVMLVDADAADLGPDRSAAALARLVDALAWQAVVWRALETARRG